MRLRVQFYAQLRDLAGTSEMDVELPESSTVRDLLEKVYDEIPALRAHEKAFWSVPASIRGARSCPRSRMRKFRHATGAGQVK
jgi:molybdopterin converting factor small subunit